MPEWGESEDVGRKYCPGCEPDADPIAEILTEKRCPSHEPNVKGLDDKEVSVGNHYLTLISEAGGEDNRRWCAFLLQSSLDRPLVRRGKAKPT